VKQILGDGEFKSTTNALDGKGIALTSQV